VQIDLDERGVVRHCAIVQSTGNRVLDAAAIKTAESGSYEPATLGSTPVGGSFAITVDFSSGV
jgi:TonB family protein